MLISVIVPVYNTAPWLRRCLDSLLNQTYRELEIICVNDGSTDDSGEILEEYAAKDQRIVIIHQENAGVSAARNVALCVARGGYVAFLDSDDSVFPDTYEKLAAYFTLEPDVVCYCMCGFDETGNPVENEYFDLPCSGLVEPTTHAIIKTDAFIGNKAFRMGFLKSKELAFPVGMRYEDAIFFYTAAALSRSICYVPEARYCYLIRGDSFTNGEAARNRAFDFCEILEILYKEFRRLDLTERWRDLYRQIFLLYYEQMVPILPSSRQRAARKMYKAMVMRLGLHKIYEGVYPFHELSRYSFFRSLFFWRNQSLCVFKFLKWPVLKIEETSGGKKITWF